MDLWLLWIQLILPLRQAFKRELTFQWFVVLLLGLTLRIDLSGVTSIIRALGLAESAYDRLLAMIHSKGVDLELLTTIWVKTVLKFVVQVQRYENRPLLVADGLKIPKSGKKMPSVRLIHQVSESNTKPEFIMGHSFQSIGVLAGNDFHSFVLPLVSRIHEGLRFSPKDKSTLLDKLLSLVLSLQLDQHFILIADAYYASGSLIRSLNQNGHHLVTRVRNNAVAFEALPSSFTQKKRGRPQKYGTKIKLFAQWDQGFESVPSPWEPNLMIRIKFRDLYWKKAQQLVRFVWVDHPLRGRILLLSSDLSIPALEILKLYAKRFKIEVAFKQAVRSLGIYAYHFWSSKMKPTKRLEKDRFLHKEEASYREAIQRKIRAFHLFVQAGLIVQGTLQAISLAHPALVLKNFGSWIRTIRPDVHPSESITASALRHTFLDFLAVDSKMLPCTKIIHHYADPHRSPLKKTA